MFVHLCIHEFVTYINMFIKTIQINLTTLRYSSAVPVCLRVPKVRFSSVNNYVRESQPVLTYVFSMKLIQQSVL